jgi:hypothetical protein
MNNKLVKSLRNDKLVGISLPFCPSLCQIIILKKNKNSSFPKCILPPLYVRNIQGII